MLLIQIFFGYYGNHKTARAHTLPPPLQTPNRIKHMFQAMAGMHTIHAFCGDIVQNVICIALFLVKGLGMFYYQIRATSDIKH